VTVRGRGEFGTFLASVGKLAAGRQLSAAALMVAFLAFPNLAPEATVEDVVWAYYAVLILSSLLLLGLDRIAATLVAERGDTNPVAALSPALVLRTLSAIPVVPALWLLLVFVDVHLPPGAWWATVVWSIAVLVQLTLFGALRSLGNAWAEPSVYLGARAVQAIALVVLPDASSTVLVVVLAAVDVAGAVVAARALGWGWRSLSIRGWTAGVPWRRAVAYWGMDLNALFYLRASLLVVGRLLGARAGAIFGLLYRPLDGLLGVQNAASLWLFAETVRRRALGEDTRSLRDRSLLLFPALAVMASLVMILAAGLVGEFVSFLRGGVDTLRLLLVTLPLVVVSVTELYVRSALGRNRSVLAIGAIALTVNVLLNVWLVNTMGFDGAAWALLMSELVQVALVVGLSTADERPLVARQAAHALFWSSLLLLLTLSLIEDWPVVAAAAAVSVVVSVIAYFAKRS